MTAQEQGVPPGVLGPYRAVLRRPGAAAFSAAGAVARIPLSMVALALVLVVEDRTSSYLVAGTVSAAHVLGAAAVAPLQGRVVDRLGQTRVLATMTVTYVLAMTVLISVLAAGAPTGWTHLSAASTGLLTPQVGSLVRARWAHVIADSPAASGRDRDQLSTAFSLEAVVDEVVFVIGPVLVTWLTLEIAWWSGLTAALLAGAGGSTVLALSTATAPPARPRSHHQPGRLEWRLLGPVVAAAVAIGTVFGSTEVVVVAVTDAAGLPGTAGLLLALWAAGSLVAGLYVGSRPAVDDLIGRLRLSVTALGLSFVVPLFIAPTLGHGVVALAVALFFSGVAISPSVIAATQLVHEGIAADRLTEALTWISLGLSIGVAPGAALAGAVVDANLPGVGASGGFLVPLIAGTVAALVTWVAGPRLRMSASPAPSSTEAPPAPLGCDAL